ncbi:hypothetical protein [Sphingomonas sp.]|uniref:hypothetical protein n=1 Tax=Sphingomonas sp. TaxID=28214 RepID=UPI002E15386F|nr:hypothetical protein [Sphingomonas sp.]
MDVERGRLRAIRAALASEAYDANRVRLSTANLQGFDCLVSSRNGLYAVNRAGSLQVAHGFFFGLRQHGDTIFAFESCAEPHSPSARGRIVAITLVEGQIANARVIARGLDNQCHQLAVIDNLICVVDTANQVIRRYTLDGAEVDVRTPLPPVRWGEKGAIYRHMNSIARVAGEIAVMLHNGAGPERRPSELAWLDAEWRIARIETLAGYGCHDILEDAAGVIWHCGSWDGELLRSNGVPIRVSTNMTRGLALGPEGLIVGVSEFRPREQRTLLAGSVLYLDDRYRVIEEVLVDGAPTDLMAINL